VDQGQANAGRFPFIEIRQRRFPGVERHSPELGGR
jgi:hypothetical protein